MLRGAEGRLPDADVLVAERHVGARRVLARVGQVVAREGDDGVGTERLGEGCATARAQHAVQLRGGRARLEMVQHGLADGQLEATTVERQLLTGRGNEVDRLGHTVQLGAAAGDGDAAGRDVHRGHARAAARQLGRHLPHAAAELEHLAAAQVADELGDSGHRAVLEREGGEVAVRHTQLVVARVHGGQRIPLGDLDLVRAHGRTSSVGAWRP